MLRNWAFI